MHLGNGAITPECAVVGFAAATAGLSASWMVSGRSSQPTPWLKAAALGSLVFAAQMVNLPVLATSSAHFVGGVLLAELLGPALGAATMAIVLLLQAILLGDGGLAAFGVNIVNMALVPAGIISLGRRFAMNRSLLVGTASALSILSAVVLISGEIALGRSSLELAAWSEFVVAMAVTHLPVALLEAALTVGLVALGKHLDSMESQPAWRLAILSGAAAVFLALMAGSVSSDLPDGYEAAAQQASMPHLLD